MGGLSRGGRGIKGHGCHGDVEQVEDEGDQQQNLINFERAAQNGKKKNDKICVSTDTRKVI